MNIDIFSILLVLGYFLYCCIGVFLIIREESNYRTVDGCEIRPLNGIVGKDLSCKDFRYTDLNSCDLRSSNFHCSDMSFANLSSAILYGCNFQDSYLDGSNLSEAFLDEEEKIRKGIKLSENIIGWKKCENNVLVKMEIPRGAIVFSINNRECRTDKVKVLEIIGADRAYVKKETHLNRDKNKYLSYYVGDCIEVHNFNCEYNIEDAEGIHFFRTREEAENSKYINI